MVILTDEPYHVVLVGDGCVARRILWSLAGRQADHGIVVRGIEEKGNGVPIPMGIAVDDTVWGRETPVIGPASQHIARVDQDGPWRYGCVKPRTSRRTDGQPGQGGLGQHGQKTRIRVWRYAILRILTGLRGGIVRHSQG